MNRSDHVLLVGSDSLSKFGSATGLHSPKSFQQGHRLEQFKATYPKSVRVRYRIGGQQKVLRKYRNSDLFAESSDAVGALLFRLEIEN